MNSQTNLKVLLILITTVALISIGFKIQPILENYDDFNPEMAFKVNYNYFFKSNDKNVRVKSFIPKSNARQRISEQQNESDPPLLFSKAVADTSNIRGIWFTNKKNTYHALRYAFVFEGKERRFTVPEHFDSTSNKYRDFLSPSENIQSDYPAIIDLAFILKQNAKNDKQILKNIFNHVLSIPSAPIITLTDAVTAFNQNRASCNGKSRLLVALARSLGYPARIKGGIILENINKRTSHVWVEILINEKWIPFDALNNHFAYLPANYLEIYNGDEFLITHSAGIQFDYDYQIKKVDRIAFLKMNAQEIRELSSISLWSIVEDGVLPKEALKLLLLLPLGGLLIAFLRNVVGVKTFGVFLPVLIAFSLLQTGFVSGIILFITLLFLVGLISYPFDKIGLLYTPKLVISLSIMVGLMLVATAVGIKYDITWLTTLTFFPTIIITIAAERFSRAAVEEGYKIAIDKLFQTLLATSICYSVLSLSWLPGVLIIFPEFILLIITFAMLLGRYIGIRWVEFYRFKPLFS